MANPQLKAPISDNEMILTVLNGPESGVGYKLMGQNVSLGRAAENDVVLRDSKSSRSHAIIERRGDQYWITDLDSKTGVYVNGKQLKESPLQPGDRITLGETQIRIGLPQALSLVNSAPPMPAAMGMPPMMSGHLPLTKNQNLGLADGAAPAWLPPINNKPGPRSSSRRSSSKNNNLVPIILVVAAAIGLIAFQKHNSTERHNGVQVKGDADFDEQLEVTTDANDKTQQEILRKGKDTQQYSEAQAFYLRGFREFRESNYSRAIQNFQAALALYPNHPLAKRYLERSILKNSELVTAALERGEKDFQLQRYNNAFNEYRTVILLTNDARSKDYQLAQKRIEAIQLIMVNSK